MLQILVQLPTASDARQGGERSASPGQIQRISMRSLNTATGADNCGYMHEYTTFADIIIVQFGGNCYATRLRASILRIAPIRYKSARRLSRRLPAERVRF